MIIASDSLLTVQRKSSSDLSYVGLCASEIKDLGSLLDITFFIHVRRTVNEVAHSLANFVVSSPASFFLDS